MTPTGICRCASLIPAIQSSLTQGLALSLGMVRELGEKKSSLAVIMAVDRMLNADSGSLQVRSLLEEIHEAMNSFQGPQQSSRNFQWCLGGTMWVCLLKLIRGGSPGANRWLGRQDEWQDYGGSKRPLRLVAWPSPQRGQFALRSPSMMTNHSIPNRASRSREMSLLPLGL